MQGFNMGRYRPPDSDPRRQSFNSHTGTHPLGKRARHLKSRGRKGQDDHDHGDDQGHGDASSSSSAPGIATSDGLTVRFELPFPVWCSSCSALLPQGTRYNARKSHAGSYHSTPIWAFTCRCRECSAEFEVRTDPARTRYVVARGGREKVESWEKGSDDEDNTMAGRVFDLDKERALERRSLRDAVAGVGADPSADSSDPFAKLDRTASHQSKEAARTKRILELESLATARSADPCTLNSALRASFRTEKRKRLERAGREDEVRRELGWSEGRRVILAGDDVVEEEKGSRQWKAERERFLQQEAARTPKARPVSSNMTSSSTSADRRHTSKIPAQPQRHIDRNPAARKLAQSILSRGSSTRRAA